MNIILTQDQASLVDNQWKVSLPSTYINKKVILKYSSDINEIEISSTIKTSTDPMQIPGKVLGSYSFNNYLILFSKLGEKKDAIYGINFNKDPLTLVTFFKGNLNFKEDSKFEIIGVYENEAIQKIYWIDGINQPRCINIAEDLNKIRKGNVYQFDFLAYNNQILEVEVIKQYETGIFKAGTVQYVFNYYNKNGRQTNLLTTTPIQYVSNIDRGNEVDTPVNCSFKLICRNINTDFDYLRIYSIHRASQDTTPSVRIVTDIPTKYAISKDYSVKALEYVDNGIGGESFDYSALLFMNNLAIVPTTMDAKDNTLFLGNLEYISQYDVELKETIAASNLKLDSSIFQHSLLIQDSKKQYYPYTNQNQFSSNDILGFKGGEHYIFGLIVQDYTDRWTSVIPLGEPIINPLYPKVIENSSLETYDIYIVKAFLPPSFIKNLQTIVSSVGAYKAFKVVIATLNNAQQRVLCQGIVSQTVFDEAERCQGSIPYTKSSWFFRPMMLKNPKDYSEKLIHNISKNDGTIFEFRHYAELNDEELPYTYNVSDSDTNTIETKPTRYRVDSQILTLHSPDIEFNDSLRHILKDNPAYKFRIIGYTKIHSSYADSNIVAENLVGMTTNGETFANSINLDKKYNSYRQAVPAAGLSYYFGVQGPTYAKFFASSEQQGKRNSHIITTQEDKTGWAAIIQGSDYGTVETSLKDADSFYYKIYPWNRSTSLNAQTTPEKSEGENSSVVSDWMVPLEQKVISNVRCCGKTVLGERIWENTYKAQNLGNGISSIGVWDETDKLIKLKDTTCPIAIDITYQGAIDTVVTGLYNTELYKGTKDTGYKKINGLYSKCRDLIRMKYKSSAHAVLALNYNYYKDGEILRWQQWTLPLPTHDINNTLPTRTTIDRDNIPAWLDTQELDYINSTATPNYKTDLPQYPIMHAYNDSSFVSKYTEGGTLIISSKDSKASAFLQAVRTACNLLKGDVADVIILLKNPTASNRVSLARNLDYFKLHIDANSNFTSSYLEDNYIFMEEGKFKYYQAYDSRDGSKLRVINAQLQNIGSAADSNAQDNGNLVIQEPYVIQPEDDGIFYIAELYQDVSLDTSDYALQNYMWQAASKEISFDTRATVDLYGDTYFQRYDCLKTYAYTDQDPNQIVDIASFMVETKINIDGRWDRNRGSISNNNMHSENFNMINKAYTQKDILTSNVVDSTSPVRRYPNSITWTLTKVFGEDIDSWTKLTNTSMLNLDGDQGELQKIINYQNSLLFLQNTAIGFIKYNENIALQTSSGVPVELANSGKVEGTVYLNTEIGCQNKDTIVISKNALYFIDGTTSTIYQIKTPQEGANPTSLSDNSFVTFLRQQDLNKVKGFYNRNQQDIYFIFYDNIIYPCLTYNEQMQNFTSFYSYYPDFLHNIEDETYHIINEQNSASIWLQNRGHYNYFYCHNVENFPEQYSPFYITIVGNGEDQRADKIWNNLEFRADSWNQAGLLQSFNTFDQLRVWNEYQQGTTNLTRVGYQNSQAIQRSSINIPSSLKKKFRIWRANFPRAQYNPEIFINVKEKIIPDIPDRDGEMKILFNLSYSRDRIRNPWTYIQLGKWEANTLRTVLHDLVIYYYE